MKGPVGGVTGGGVTGGGITGTTIAGKTYANSGLVINGFLKVSANTVGTVTENTAESPNKNGAVRVRSLSLAAVHAAVPGIEKLTYFVEVFYTIWRFITSPVSLQ